MKILLAEDEKDLSRVLTAALTHQGFSVDSVYNGRDAVEKASQEAYDLMILDIMMPEMNGIEALSQIRKSGDVTPVLMLTAKAEVEDRIIGLDAGADDYLTKPFSMGELMARVRALTRRSGSFTPTTLSMGNMTLNTEEQELTACNSIRLSGKETRLMEFFMLNAGKVLSTEELYKHAWKDEPMEDMEIVYVYISYLRQKLLSIDSNLIIFGEKDGSYILMERNRFK
ncbi:MAG TPA: DNA-binding response regulator [Lachnospiraceae bacterium]|nr:DNA-binding response regulator [Lachnospiraceae bacterium]